MRVSPHVRIKISSPTRKLPELFAIWDSGAALTGSLDKLGRFSRSPQARGFTVATAKERW